MDAAAGAIATSRDKLRTMLSKCTYWQQFGGASYTEAQALARIYLDGMPFLDDLLSDPTNRPLAVIGRGARGVHWQAVGGPRTFAVDGALTIEFHRTPTTLVEADPGAFERSYENDIARIISAPDGSTGLLQLSGLDTNLDILDVTEEGPIRASGDLVSLVGDASLYYVDIEWGTRR